MTAGGRDIAICVVDDHPVIAEGIRKVVEATPGIACVGVATNPAELEALLARHKIDVAILDVRLAGANGIDLCASLNQRFPNMRVLMLSSFGDSGVVRRALAAGASGFALKSIALDMLPAAIRQVKAGGIFLSSELVAEAMPSGPRSVQESALTPRETEIVQLVAEGKSNKEIARDLGLSSHTVKLHVSRLLKRFDYRRRSQLSGLGFQR
jgi:DNA-binding NarL/FixJ family response regulator